MYSSMHKHNWQRKPIINGAAKQRPVGGFIVRFDIADQANIEETRGSP